MNEFLLIPLKEAEAAIADEDLVGDAISWASTLIRDALNSRSQNGPSQVGSCIHFPPSPGQSLCQCGHMRIELEYAVALADRAAVERAGREA